LAAGTRTTSLPELPAPFGCSDIFFPGHGNEAAVEGFFSTKNDKLKMTGSKQPKHDSSSKPVPKEQASSQKPKPGKKDLSQILKSANRRGLKPKGQQGLIDFKSPDQNQ